MQSSDDPAFRVGQKVHSKGQPGRIGTVKYVGPVEGLSGNWVGVDWEGEGEGKHDGAYGGVRYFIARGPDTASFARPHNLTCGVSLLEALEDRYRTGSTKQEEDEMYILSVRKKKVAIELLGKEKIENKFSRIEELASVSLSYSGVNFSGSADQLSSKLPNLKELDLAGNLLSSWEDVGVICKALPSLTVLNLSNNFLSSHMTSLNLLDNIRILVLNQTGVTWNQVEHLKNSIPSVEELHLIGNNISEITPVSLSTVQGFNSLRLLNLDNNAIHAWDDVIKLSQLCSLEQLSLNSNNLSHAWYPEYDPLYELDNRSVPPQKSVVPFESLRGLFLGGNNIDNLESVDSLNSFPSLVDIRLSENPVADLGSGGVPRFVFIARLAKVKILNGSEVSPRERKDSEIRYVRFVMAKLLGDQAETRKLYPRFDELKKFHGIEDERPSTVSSGPQKMASGLISVTLKCVGASMGEKPPLVKKLPPTTTVGKLKNLCESFFKLKSVKPIILYLQEQGSPLPALLEDDMASLVELGVGNDSTVLVDEEEPSC